jgi:hypothetical protein
MKGIVFLLMALALTEGQEQAVATTALDCPAVREGRIPSIWVQLGPPRTASTVQYVTLLLIGHILCPQLHTSFVWWPGKATNKLNVSYNNPNGLQIYKVHQDKLMEKINKDTPLYLFYSTDKNISAKDKTKALKGKKVTYVQEMQRLIDSNDSLVSDYKDFFNLSSRAVNNVATYVKYFSIIRQCCGAQASHGWVEYLRGNTNKSHICLDYDLQDTELKLEAHAKLHNLPLLVYKPGYCNCTTASHREIKKTEHYNMKRIKESKPMKECERKHNRTGKNSRLETIPLAASIVHPTEIWVGNTSGIN